MDKALDTASKKRKKMALGRGLDSLIPDMQSFDSTAGSESSLKEFFRCDIGDPAQSLSAALALFPGRAD
jgi:hypothetical protein